MTIVDARLDHLATAARHAAEPDQWPVAPRFSPAGRWYHRLAQDDDHEVWLLTWLPGQGTDLHDHGGSAGAFLVVSGTLVEETLVEETPAGATSLDRPAGPPRLAARELGESAGRRFGPRHVHRIINTSARPAVSVHVYAPALTTMTRYRITDAGLAVVDVDRAGAQW